MDIRRNDIDGRLWSKEQKKNKIEKDNSPEGYSYLKKWAFHSLTMSVYEGSKLL